MKTIVILPPGPSHSEALQRIMGPRCKQRYSRSVCIQVMRRPHLDKVVGANGCAWQEYGEDFMTLLAENAGSNSLPHQALQKQFASNMTESVVKSYKEKGSASGLNGHDSSKLMHIVVSISWYRPR